jgi:endonuclease YncB( thermonuclease family)
VDNYDGDTIKFNIPGIHPLLGKKILIRVRGIDAPEVRSKDSCEKDMAIYVRNHLRDLLLNAGRIDLINIERDKYFRIVAEVKIDRLLVGEYLLSQGFATAYNGAKKPRVNWCEPWDQINFPDQSFTMAP